MWKTIVYENELYHNNQMLYNMYKSKRQDVKLQDSFVSYKDTRIKIE